MKKISVLIPCYNEEENVEAAARMKFLKSYGQQLILYFLL